MRKIALLTVGVLAFEIALPALAAAQSLHTYVSGTGAGTLCSLAAPCATFQNAHDKTTAGGVVTCLDAGEYGPVNINRSITIDCVDTGATILGTDTGGINILTGDSFPIVVNLRGLTIDGGSASPFGIAMNSAGELHIERCRISGFRNGTAAAGIILASIDGSALDVSIADTIVTHNGSAAESPDTGGGILVLAAGATRGVLDRVEVSHNFPLGIGATAFGTAPSALALRDSAVVANVRNGIATSAANNGAFRVSVDRTSVSLNGGAGIVVLGASVVMIGQSTIAGNGSAFDAGGGGQIVSYQDNQTDGTPTSTVTDR